MILYRCIETQDITFDEATPSELATRQTMGYWLHLVFHLLDFIYKLNECSTALNAMSQSGETGYDWKQDMQSETPTSVLSACAELQPDAVMRNLSARPL